MSTSHDELSKSNAQRHAMKVVELLPCETFAKEVVQNNLKSVTLCKEPV